MTPKNPNFESDVRTGFSQQGLMGLIGARLEKVEPGYVEIHLPYRPDLTQQHGYFHAGMITTIADNAGGFAAYTLMPQGTEVLAVEFKINVMNPGDGELLIAKARVLKPGRTLTVCAVDVDIVKGGQSKVCAAMLQTLICLSR